MEYKEGKEYTIRLAQPSEAESIYNIMNVVYNDLDNKDLFVCDSLEYVQHHLSHSESGFGVVAVDKEEKIAGSFIVRFPGMEEDNLGYDIGMRRWELPKVVHMESAVVLPQHRGHSLQRRMLQFAEEQLQEKQSKQKEQIEKQQNSQEGQIEKQQSKQEEHMQKQQDKREVHAYYMATVSPDNPASLRCFLKNGYKEVLRKEKYGGMERIILKKDNIS